MTRFPKKILLPLSGGMYSELLDRSKANGTSINAEIRLAIAASTRTAYSHSIDKEGIVGPNERRAAFAKVAELKHPLDDAVYELPEDLSKIEFDED
jgi:hypothetical protein